MKYANLIFNGICYNNLGDNMQLIALDYIYECMNIPKEDIIYINKNNLAEYDGEEVVLPISMPLVDQLSPNKPNRFSEKITPVFLGLTMVKDTLSAGEIDLYKHHEPVGCRDERTLNTLLQYGIKCYLNGCITVVLPYAEKINRSQKTKIFFVDTPENLEELAPLHIQKNIENATHNRFEIYPDAKAVATEQYKKYINEASLVVTSLLHCAVPCMAAGIPVILAKTICSYRFGWVEKLLPIYTKDDFQNIDWNPEPVHYEVHKKRVLENAMARIKEVRTVHEQTSAIHEFYFDRVRKNYEIDAFLPIQTYIDTNWDKDGTYEYAIWGITQIAAVTVSYITENFPNAKLVAVYDLNTQKVFEGIRAISPDEINGTSTEHVFVTTAAATKKAKELFAKIGKKSENYTVTDIIY